MGSVVLKSAETQSIFGANESPQTLSEWTEWLRDQELPIFSHTVLRITQTLADENAHALELSNIILEDPGLTTKLLKLANSSYYNPSNQQMGTITRAIVILGSKVIKELTLACSLIESIISKNNNRYVSKEIGRALHAAVQAKSIAIMASDSSPEEVFIAALLNNLGRIAFGCYETERSDEIHQLIEEKGLPPEKAEKKVLGFSLKKLGASLSKTWNLGGLIDDILINSGRNQDRTYLVDLGHRIAEYSEQGWDCRQMQVYIGKIAEITQKDSKVLLDILKENTQAAVNIASQLGAHGAVGFIPSQVEVSEPAANTDEPIFVTSEGSNIQLQLQLQILQDIATMVHGKIDVNILFETVMEGIHRGIGMDRTLFALMTPDHKILKEKSSLGWPLSLNQQKFLIPLNSPNLFSHAFGRNEALWVKPTEDNQLNRLFTPQVQVKIGFHECFLMPISLNNQAIGLFYADQSLSARKLYQQDFDSFKHFVQHANIGLALSQMHNLGKT